MTRPELCRWLGVPDDKPIHAGLVADMEPVPFPASDAEEVAAFAAFLESTARHGIKP